MTSVRWTLRLSFVWMLMCLAIPVAAQTAATGNIEGVVTDVSGGVLPGVTVLVRNVQTNVSRETVTDSDGRFRAGALQPAEYEVSATLSGFSVQPVTGLRVLVGQTVTVDLQMRPAGVTETVSVTAESPILDTRRTDVSNVITQEMMQNLPITGRRWDNYVLMSPGVTNDGNFGLVAYRGISGLYNNNMVDGVDNNQAFFSEARGRTRTVYSISQATIKEFQVGISNMSAEFGRAAGGTVNAVTKSGTNNYSGEGFYFLRDDSFQAKNPFVNIPGDPGGKPDERRQQFGLALGGPIKKDRVFFFGGYDQQVRTFPAYTSPSNATFLTAPCTAPAANCAATLSFFNSVAGLSPREGNNKVSFIKVDSTLNGNHTLTLSYNGHRWDSPNGIQTQPVITVADSMNGSDLVKTDFFVGSLNSILGQKWLNEFRVQIGRDNEEQQPNGVPPGTTVTGGIGFGMPDFLPRTAFPHEQRYQFINAITSYWGAHSVKAGADINFVKELQINLFRGGGVYSYSSFSALANDCPIGASGCTPVVDAAAGRHYSNFQQAFDLNGLAGKMAFNTWDYNFYVQDTWRVNNALLVNLGLRYEYQQLPQPGDVQVDGVTFAGNPLYPETQEFNQDKTNWGPRIGVSYDFGGNHATVLRGSYGIFYGRTSNSAVANALTNTGNAIAGYFFTPTTAGAPVYPAILSAPPTIAGSVPDVQYFATNLKRPMIQSVDVTLDRQVMRDVTVSASYLFSRGSRLPAFRDINFNPANSQVRYVLDGQALGTFPLYRGARPVATATRILVLEPRVESIYHALVLAANKRFSGGILLGANYTLSKAEDDQQNSSTFFGGNQPYDTLNLDLVDGRTTSTLDRRHKFSANFLYQPPQLWGIGISGVLVLESGLPISETISGTLSAAVGATNSSSTNGTGGATFAPWLGRNTNRYPGRATLDLRLSKRFALGRGTEAEVLWDMFNLFNRTNVTTASDIAFNVASSTFDAAANLATVNLTRNAGYLVPTSSSNTFIGSRDMQLGLRFLW
ncbi:MAG TPA: carboxypeptidase regulatory-like domain-containing protein [Vicinamibacterales bacterium]